MKPDSHWLPRRGAPAPRTSTGNGHRWLAAAALVVMLALAAWGVYDDPRPPTPAPAGVDFPWATTAQLAEEPAATTPTRHAATAARAPAPVSSPEAFDLCGHGRVSAPTGSAETAAAGLDALPAPVGRDALAEGRRRMLATLHAGTPAQQAAALLLDRPDAADTAALEAWAQRLLKVAEASGQVQPLVWAEEACGYRPDGPACRLGLIRARLRLEPDNGLHWAALADEDPAAADEAWQGLRAARHWHARPQALLLVAQAAIPRELPAYLQQALGTEAQSRSAALASPGDGLVLAHCGTPADGGRPAACEPVIDTLLRTADGTQALAQAVHLAAASGWPEERLRPLQAELRAMATSAARWQPEPEQPLSCSSVDGWRLQLAEMEKLGELGALRARLAERGPLR